MDTLLSDDEKLIKNTIKDYSNQEIAPRASNYDLNNEFPWKNIQGLAELGMFGLTIEEKYGGTGGTMRQLCIVVEEISKACASTGIIYIAHLSLCAQLIQMYGNKNQKEKYLPELVNANKIGAFALTEPDAGSDAGGLNTTLDVYGDDAFTIDQDGCYANQTIYFFVQREINTQQYVVFETDVLFRNR